MNRSDFIKRIAYFIGYLLFAGFSAYFTSTSLSLNLFSGENVWIIFVLVLVISILAGWCLTNVIIELKKRRGASRSKFVLNFLGFVIFWAFSFTTNVHYFFVEKHGLPILTKELASAKQYISNNTTESNRDIESRKSAQRNIIIAQIEGCRFAYVSELQNTLPRRIGFGPQCISILQNAENILQTDAKSVGDKHNYIGSIFKESTDAGDRGVNQESRQEELQNKYVGRINIALDTHLKAIDNYWESKKNQNTDLLALMPAIDSLERYHLPSVEKDGSTSAFFTYSKVQDTRVINKMPEKYSDKIVTKNKAGKIIKYKVYPSQRMFDTMSVWGDILSGRLVGLPMLQWIIISLIFDIVAFILFAMFRKQEDD